MRTRHKFLKALALGFSVILIPSVEASFHFMQIEQVIGGVNGDSMAQAIQLRMRSSFQNLVSASRIRAWDAAGSNPILIIDMTQNVANSQTGDRVLIASPAFVDATSPAAVPDFAMAALIPESYFSAGSLTFEDDFGTVYWRLSWGGANYTGSTFGASDNDDDPGFVPANFGPPFPGALPSTTLQALRFTGTATAVSTTNLANYAITTGAATCTNNARASFTVIAPAPVEGDIDGDRDVDVADFARCVACLAGPEGKIPATCREEDFAACDLHQDAAVDLFDIAEITVIATAP